MPTACGLRFAGVFGGLGLALTGVATFAGPGAGTAKTIEVALGIIFKPVKARELWTNESVG